jgi:membrane protein implicated in regulation of membrane protease activity
VGGKPNVLLAALGIAAMASSVFLAVLDTEPAVVLAFLFAGLILALFSVIEPRLEGTSRSA